MQSNFLNWKPNEDGLKEVLSLLNDSRAGSTNIQKEVNRKLDQYKQLPEFSNYLVYVFSMMTQQDIAIRQLAGILLKNNIRELMEHKKWDHNSPSSLHIKQVLLQTLQDPESVIRSTAGSTITAISQDLRNWPDIIPVLIQMMDQNSQTNAPQQVRIVEGCVGAIAKICEECFKQLASPEFVSVINMMFQKLVQYFYYPHSETVKYKALICFLYFLPMNPLPNGLIVQMEPYLKGVFALANDSKSVRKYVCRTFAYLLDHPIYLKPFITDVFKYCLVCSQDSDDQLALEATEFFTAFSENSIPEFLEHLKPFLPQLVPILLKGMIYSEMEKATLEYETERPDKESDIAPHIVKSRAQNLHKNITQITSAGQQPQQPPSLEEDFEDEDDDEDDDDANYDEQNEWTLRKCSASCLDLLSNIYRGDVLPIIIEHLQPKMQPNQPWDVRESAVLAIGAIAEGCKTGMYHYLPQIIPYLFVCLEDPVPLVRSIACWTLSRYSNWLVEQPEEKFFKPALAALLNRVLDRNKKVQEAACSAFATLEEKSGELLIHYLGPILQALSSAFVFYQRKNLLILYDAIGTLAEQVGDALHNEQYVTVILPPILQKWQNIQDLDRKLLPVLECLTSLVASIRTSYANFAKPVFDRCIRLIHMTYINEDVYAQHQDDNYYPDKDFVICSLDLIGATVDALGDLSGQLIESSPQILPLLLRCMKDNVLEVRQSAFGVIGDLAKNCVKQLFNMLPQYVPEMIQNLNPYTDQKQLKRVVTSVCNNTCWALGEIAIQIKKEMAVFSDPILAKLIHIINDTQLNSSLLENAAIAIGRMALACPEKVAPLFKTFAKNWSLALRDIRDEVEKEHAFSGLCILMRTNPQGALDDFAYICDAIAFYEEPPNHLKAEFKTILHAYKQSLGTQWPAIFAKFPKHLASTLTQLFGL